MFIIVNTLKIMSKIIIKTDDEIDLMRQSGHLLAKVHEELHAALRPGISTLELDEIGERTIRALGGIPNCKDYEGFPASVCISVNNEVVHGIPSEKKIIQEGDLSVRADRIADIIAEVLLRGDRIGAGVFILKAVCP